MDQTCTCDQSNRVSTVEFEFKMHFHYNKVGGICRISNDASKLSCSYTY